MTQIDIGNIKRTTQYKKKRQFGAFLLGTLNLRMSTLRDRSSNHH
jgi:hypothetical protein